MPSPTYPDAVASRATGTHRRRGRRARLIGEGALIVVANVGGWLVVDHVWLADAPRATVRVAQIAAMALASAFLLAWSVLAVSEARRSRGGGDPDEARLAGALLDGAPVGTAVVDSELCVVRANAAFADLLGVDAATLAGRHARDLFDLGALEASLRGAIGGATPPADAPTTARHADGRLHSARLAAARFKEGGHRRLLLLVRGLEAEREAEVRARAADRRFQELVENASDAMVTVDASGAVANMNASAENMFGWKRDEMAGQPISTLMPNKCFSQKDFDRERRVATGHFPKVGTDTWRDAHNARQLEGRRRDGTDFPIEGTLSSYFSRGGEGAVICVLRDVSARRDAEEVIRRSEASFRSLIESLPDAVAVHSGGRMVYVNPTYVKYLGLAAPGDVVGKRVEDIVRTVVHPDERADALANARRAAETGRPHESRTRRLVRRDGAVVTAEVIGAAITYDGAPAVMSILRDVTERQRLEAQLVMADRLASVGTLAAGVAHEINNPLTYVITNLADVSESVEALAERREQPVAEIAGRLREVRDGVERVRQIVRDLKAFARSDPESRQLVDLNAVLESAMKIAHNEIRHRARLVRELGEVPPVAGNQGRLGQVFLNLLLNAAQAVPEGQVARNEIRVRTATSPRGEAVVEVRDTGAGIPEDKLRRIFDPFYTTKPVGEGSGLGLAICHGIVSALGGRIDVESQVGKGSLFRVTLPAMSAPPATPRRPASVAPKPGEARRRGRVLVVDDEPMIVSSLRRLLASEHDVTTTTSGGEALGQLGAGARFDVILCDLMMPEMTGMDLHAEVAKNFPEQAERMVFLTGGAFTPRAREFLDSIANANLEKPFDPGALRALVRERVG